MIGKNSLPILNILNQPTDNIIENINISSVNTNQDNPSKPPLKLTCQVKTRIPTPIGEFYLLLYHNNWDSKEHLAIVYGDQIHSLSLQIPTPNETTDDRIQRGALPLEAPITSPLEESTLVRIHSECFTGETIFSVRCDCGQQLEEAMKQIKERGSGVIVYLRQEGRGIGLLDKLRAYNVQDQGYDTVAANIMLNHPPDRRTYEMSTGILRDLRVTSVDLLTNNPTKIIPLQKDGININKRIPMVPREWQASNAQACCNTPRDQTPPNEPTELNNYLKAKITRMGHMLTMPHTLSQQHELN